MNELTNVVEVNESNFAEQVIVASERVPVLVDFWADWCAPCKMLLPVLLKLAKEYGDQLRLAKVNTDVERGLAAEHGIRSLPTLRLYRHGQVVEEVMGAQPEAALRTLIDAYIERESDRLLAEALTLAQDGDRAAALELMARAYRDDPDNPRLALEYARLCLQGDHAERADELLQALPREIREQPQARSLQALVELTRSISGAPPLAELQVEEVVRAPIGDLPEIEGRTICALGDAAAMPVWSFIKHFRHEFEHYVEHKRSLVDAA